MSIKSNLLRCAAVTAVMLFAGEHATAEVIAARTETLDWAFTTGTPIVVSTTTGWFANPKRGFLVMFSSECSVSAPEHNTQAYTDVDIVLQDRAGIEVILAPTQTTTNAFCAANGTGGSRFDGKETHSITAYHNGANLSASEYRVYVRARLQGGATGALFGERSVVVFK